MHGVHHLDDLEQATAGQAHRRDLLRDDDIRRVWRPLCIWRAADGAPPRSGGLALALHHRRHHFVRGWWPMLDHHAVQRRESLVFERAAGGADAAEETTGLAVQGRGSVQAQACLGCSNGPLGVPRCILTVLFVVAAIGLRHVLADDYSWPWVCTPSTAKLKLKRSV